MFCGVTEKEYFKTWANITKNQKGHILFFWLETTARNNVIIMLFHSIFLPVTSLFACVFLEQCDAHLLEFLWEIYRSNTSPSAVITELNRRAAIKTVWRWLAALIHGCENTRHTHTWTEGECSLLSVRLWRRIMRSLHYINEVAVCHCGRLQGHTH